MTADQLTELRKDGWSVLTAAAFLKLRAEGYPVCNVEYANAVLTATLQDGSTLTLDKSFLTTEQQLNHVDS